MLLLLIGRAIPLWISSYAVALWQFLALGLVGASFAVGTPYVARVWVSLILIYLTEVRRAPVMGEAIASAPAPVSQGAAE